MKRTMVLLVFLAMCCLGGTGCKTSSSSLLPVHDEILIFPVTMDLAYLRTMEAIQAHPDWELDYTDKEKGLINIKNMRYSSFSDADLRSATLVLKREGPKKTSVQFAKRSQSIRGGEEILDLVKQYVSAH